MERVKSIINDTEANVRIYLLKNKDVKLIMKLFYFQMPLTTKLRRHMLKISFIFVANGKLLNMIVFTVKKEL